MNNLKVAINAEIIPGGDSGGIEQVIIGLVTALGKLKDGDEEYTLVTHHRNPAWLEPYMGGNMKTVPRPWNREDRKKAGITRLKKVVGPLVKALSQPLYDWIGLRDNMEVAYSDGFWESLGVDVIHFPTQYYTISPIPSIYNPHDLQHLHFPEFFEASQIKYRETLYRTGCKYAEAVAVHLNWVKNDIITQYGTEPEKIFTIPWGAATQAYSPISGGKLSEVRMKFNLPETFALYPAKTWPHKNHIRLLQALAMLRDKHDLRLNLVCSGTQGAHWTTIAGAIRELELEGQVQFTGFVEPEELQGFYLAAQFIIIPTLFEAGSMPMLEGWIEGTPVACSMVTSLPEQAGDAALLFDPLSVEDIAEAIRRMATDDELRTVLIKRGAERVKLFSWERTARMYRALYRKISGCEMTTEDKRLFEEAVDSGLPRGEDHK